MMFRTIFFVLVFLILSTILFAQNQKTIDSLQNILKTNISAKEQVDVLNQIALSYQDKDINSLEEYGKKALEKAQEIFYIKGMVIAYKNIAWVKMVESEYEIADSILQKAAILADLQNYNQGQAEVYNVLGIIAWYQSNYSQALAYHLKALKAREKLNNPTDVAVSYNNIGLIYYKLKENQKSLDNYFKSLEIHQNQNNESHIISTYYNIATTYEAMEVYDSALYFFDEMLKKTEKLGGEYRFGFAFFGLGNVHLKLGNYQKSKTYLEKSLEIRLKLKQEKESASTLFALGKVYYEIENYSKAIKYLEQSLEIAQKLATLDLLRDVSNFLGKAYQKQGDFQKAYQYQQLFIQTKDSLFNTEQTKILTRLEADYEFSKEKDSIQIANEKEQLILEKNIENRKNIQIATYIGLGLLGVLLLISYLFLRSKQKSNQLLTQKSKELTTANQEIQVVNEELKTANEKIQTINDTLSITLGTVEKQRDEILSSIQYAQRIQSSILPTPKQVQSLLPEHFILFKPRDVVSGDFYYIKETQGKIILAAVDCTGHGIPGAFMSLIGYTALLDINVLQKITKAAQILEWLHIGVRYILRQKESEVKDGMDIALVVIDKENKTLEFAGAKNPLIYIQNEKLHKVKGDIMGIGGVQTEMERHFTTHTIDISQPTTFYLFSDGYQDQFGGKKRRKFMTKRFRELLFEIHEKPMEEQKSILETTLSDWMGKEEQVDDILVMGVKV